MREVSSICAALEFCPNYDGSNEEYFIKHFSIFARADENGVLMSLCMAQDALSGGGSCPIREIYVKARSLGHSEDFVKPIPNDIWEKITAQIFQPKEI